MDEEWVSTATDLFNVSDEDEDNVLLPDEDDDENRSKAEKPHLCTANYNNNEKEVAGLDTTVRMRPGAIRDSALRSDKSRRRSSFAIDTDGSGRNYHQQNNQSIGGEEHLLVTSQFCEQMHKLLL
jgi:hypothetical protein